MSESRVELTICRLEPEQFTLEGLALRAGLHPTLVESFMAYGLLEPVERPGNRLLFDATSLERLQIIDRLRRDLGVNLPGISVILDLRERLTALQRELTLLHTRLQ